jgi:hypothetical protein
LTFAIDNTPAPNAGVSIESNRYVDINPTPGWTGQTTVVVRVTDPGGLSDTDTFLVTVGQYADIAVTPAFFDESVPQDETLVRTLTISNTGVDDLIFVIGDGGVAWLSQDPIAGTVPGGEAQPVDVTFDATGLAEGDYSTALTISNNDPDENPMTISVTMHVTITGELADVTVSVSGNQFCAGRTTGVERCFDIDSSVPLSATVRFYFGEGERNGQPLNDLLVFHYDGDWIEEPGPYTRGGAGDAQYVEAQNVDGFSPFALGRSGPATVYLPLVSRRWPPLPYTPVLNAISNADGDGNYTVSWQSALLANTYTLQEDDNASFSSPTTAYGPGSTTSTAISGRSIGTYYYRVKATNNYGDSSWSNVQTVIVRPPDTPTLNAISNADGDGNYSVSWNAADRAQTYTLQEDDNAAFSSPTTVYDGAGTSKSISGKGVGTYYYRVQASNGAGNSGWSNVASVVVTVPLPPCEQHDFGVQGTQYYIYPSGRSWNFTAESDMAVRSVQVKSVLATSSGHTFYIQVRINDSTVASWAQYVNNTTYTAFYHSKDVSFDMHTGDKITYHISIDSSVGGIAWMNYVKLCR